MTTTRTRDDIGDLMLVHIDDDQENHGANCPFVVAEGTELRFYNKLADVLRLPPSTVVWKQWPGQYRSDWFRFTVAEAAQAYADAESVR